MSSSVQPPQVEIHDVAIDHVNVREPKRHGSIKSLVAITPLLGVLIAGTSAACSFGFKMLQQQYANADKQVEVLQKAHDEQVAAQLRADEAWRDALAKSIGSGQSATLLALEMQTFAGDSKYGSRAKAIMYRSLARIEDEAEFDAAFSGALESTMEEDQDALIAVVRKLSLELQQKYDATAKTAGGRLAVKRTLANFVENPEAFLRDDNPALAETDALKWKLDSASAGLSLLWHGTKARQALRPGQADLSGLIFLNNDFSGVDFSQVTDMSSTFFLGSCKLSKAPLPKGATDACDAK